MTEREIENLKADALRPDYGSRYYKPPVVLALIEELEKRQMSAAISTAPSRPVLRYHGGKWKLADWIISFFPPHDTYAEIYGGAASVLMRKPRVKAEIYNDLDSQIVNVFRVLRDASSAKELERQLRLTPYSRDEFNLSYESSADPIEQARRTIIRAGMSVASASATRAHRTGFRSYCVPRRNPVRDWAGFPGCIEAFTERLTGVLFENAPALDLLRRYDGPNTLFYVDPPYPFGTREVGAEWRKSYKYNLTDDDHRELSKALHGLQGMVALSGYHCELYDQELYSDWESFETATFAEGARPRVEVMWLNPAATANRAQRNLFDAEVAR